MASVSFHAGIRVICIWKGSLFSFVLTMAFGQAKSVHGALRNPHVFKVVRGFEVVA